MILLPPDGPSPHPHAPAFLTPRPGPPLPAPPSAQNAVISPEDDVQRLFNVCKVESKRAVEAVSGKRQAMDTFTPFTA